MKIGFTIMDSSNKSRLFFIFFLSVIVLITNNIVDFDHKLTPLTARDTYSYLKIAQSFPAFPDEKIFYHHAQRFITPYLIGMVSKISGISPEIVFRITTITLFFLIIFLFHKIMELLKLSSSTYILSASLFVFNPYAFRYHISFPGMASDLVFVLGLTYLFLGFFKKRFSVVVAGAVIMAVGRQTALLCIPSIILWLVFCGEWKNNSKKLKIIQSIIIIFIITSIYLATGLCASFFGMKSSNLAHVTNIFYWFSNDFNYIQLGHFILRFMVTFILPISIMAGVYFSTKIRIKQQTSLFLICILFVLSICLQPVLGGPGITSGNIQRLSSLASVPFILAFSIYFEETHFFETVSSLLLVLLVVGITVSSLHHIYTFIGPNTEKTVQYGIIHFSIAFLSFLAIRFHRNKSPSKVNP